MERPLFRLLRLLCIGWVAGLLPALQAAPAPVPAPRPIRVLFLGHESEHHDSGKYLPYVMAAFGRDGIYFDYFTKPDCLNAKTLAGYDAVMLYANHGAITPEQFTALNSFVESGHGFLPIHCASWCFSNEPKFAALVGGHFKSHGEAVFKPVIVDKNHPVMAGVNEYEAWDETYVHDQINTEGRTLLMERVEGDVREPWTWVRNQGKGRVFYTASGHDERVWKNAEFQKMLRNAIVWSVGDKVKAEWEKFLSSREPEVREENPFVANYERRPKALTFQKPFSVKGSMERTQVASDLKLELFASEPDIRKPISMAWDERGRLWIAETSDYPHGVTPDGKGHDSIRICEDTNGDGKADKFTVFASDLNIPTGLVFVNGGVIVSQPPRFLFLKDTDGDDKADVREEVMTGWGVGDTHAQASNLHYGFDNWLYGCVGYSGFGGQVGGKRMGFGQGTYRFSADGSKLEFLHQFTNNSWAQSQNEAGDQFGGTANGAPIFFGGIPRTAFPEGMRGMTAKRINVVNEAHTITPNFRQVDVMGGYTAAAGSNFIYSANMPPRLQGMAMVCEPTMKLIGLMDVRPAGAGYVARDGFNLLASSDEWLSPVCASVGPDGAVWVADFQNFIIQHNPTPSLNNGGFDAKTGPGGAHENPLRDHDRGRIYRVVWKDAKKPAITSLKGATTAALVAALGNDNLFWRLKAQQMLVEGKHADAVPALKKVVAARESGVAAVHALWALQGLGQLDEATHKSALLATDARLRRNAIRALGTDATAQTLLFSSGVVSDADPATRLAAFVKLSELPTSGEINTLVSKVSTDPVVLKDEWLAEAGRLLTQKHAPFKEGPNLLTNASFENAGANALPDGWKTRTYGGGRGNASSVWDVAPEGTRPGEKSARFMSKGGFTENALFLEAPLKPNTYYTLSGKVKVKDLRGRALLRDQITGFETSQVGGNTDWTELKVTYNSGASTKAGIDLLFNGEPDATVWFDDVKLVEMLPADGSEEKVAAGDPKRGEDIFWKHPVAACANCHMLGGKGSTVGPALDGIARRKDEAYILQSLLEPNAALAEGYTATPVSPMPPMGLILKPQELADIKAFILGLK